jgi:hypothetical protein
VQEGGGYVLIDFRAEDMLDDMEGKRWRCEGCWFGKTSSFGKWSCARDCGLIEYAGGVGGDAVQDENS